MGLMVDLSPGIGRALVAGGGAVAARKVRGLLEAGFKVLVVAPEIREELRALDGVSVRQGAFAEADLEGVGIAFACTDSRAVNRAIGEAARRRGIPVNVADRREESTFTSAAIHRDGDLMIGVVTGGASPGLATEVRERIAESLGSGWEAKVSEARQRREGNLRRKRGSRESQEVQE